MKFLKAILIFLFFTILTQIGGVIYLLFHWISNRKKWTPWKRRTITVMGYMLATLIVVPLFSSRKPLPWSGNLKPLNVMTCLLNRHYVKPELYKVLEETSIKMKQEGRSVIYLDACFPFFDGFPLIPHLSHNDGEKVDLTFCYKNQQGEKIEGSPSIIGYGVSVDPLPGQSNTVCDKYWQYSLLNRIMPQCWKESYILDEKATKLLVTTLVIHNSIGKLFIEPHLKERMRLNNSKIRFHGCHAVRHDDHLHIQLK